MLKRDSRLGQYQIVRFLGEGGMGAVYEALHVELNKRVALKTLRSDVEALPTVKERFLREGRSAARIKHPNIVDVYDSGQSDGVAFLVMEYLDGEDLETVLRRETRLPVERALDIMVPVLAAVAAVHQQGIIHRDLKPQNVFLTKGAYGESVPKVLDFGISKISTADAALTGAGEALGSPYYMSPEQARGVTELDPRSDQFGLAVILYELLTGVRPFDAPNVIAVLFAIQTCQPVPLGERLPGTPEVLGQAVARAMSRDAKDRFADVLEFGRVVLPFAGERTRLLWGPLLGASSQAAPVAEAPEPLPAEERTSIGRNPLAETGPQPAVDSPAAAPVAKAPRTPTPAPPRPRPTTDPGRQPRPATTPPPPGRPQARQASTPPPPGRSQIRPATEAARSGIRSNTGALRAVGPRPATPARPSRPRDMATPPLPQPAPSARRQTPVLPIKSTPAAAAAAAQRRRWQEETPFEPEPFETPGLPSEEESTSPPGASARGVQLDAQPGEQADDNTLLCISLSDAGATTRARQLIRSSPRLVMLCEAKGSEPDKRPPLCHILAAARGALDVVVLCDDGKGGWRDPMGDLCKQIAPDRYEAKTSYVMLQGGSLVHIVRKDLFDPLADAEKVSDWVAGRCPGAQRYKRPKE